MIDNPVITAQALGDFGRSNLLNYLISMSSTIRETDSRRELYKASFNQHQLFISVSPDQDINLEVLTSIQLIVRALQDEDSDRGQHVMAR